MKPAEKTATRGSVYSPVNRVIATAFNPRLSHGAFRLYVILDEASRKGRRQARVENGYFLVTLEGLMRLHPGIGGRTPGPTTVIKQVAELREAGLLALASPLHRKEPRVPTPVKILSPVRRPGDVRLESVALVANTQ